MGKTKGSFEKKELAGLSSWVKALAFKYGKEGAKALEAGVWPIAETFKGRATGISIESATKRLVKLMEEAARGKDGTKLRLLAYAVEARRLSNIHDPLRAMILSMKAPDHLYPGMVCTPLNAPRTAEAIQDALRHVYTPDSLPTLKNIREVAVELDVKLLKRKPGAPPGIGRKTQHRAKR